MKHTQEPWAYKKPFSGHVTGKYGTITCSPYGCDIDNVEANAERIVACVNACAGVPDEILMRQGIDGWIWRHDRDRLAALNAELRKALIKYGRHDPRCPAKITCGECDCGFDDAVGCDE